MKKLFTFCMLFFCSLLFACAPSSYPTLEEYHAKQKQLQEQLSIPSEEFFKTWKFSKKPTMNQFEKLVKAEMENILHDPYSAKYYFEQPLYKTYHYDFFKLNGYYPEEEIFVWGWGAYFYVNAKNKMGGYTGKTPYKAIINNNKIVYLHKNFGADGLFTVDELIMKMNNKTSTTPIRPEVTIATNDISLIQKKLINLLPQKIKNTSFSRGNDKNLYFSHYLSKKELYETRDMLHNYLDEPVTYEIRFNILNNETSTKVTAYQFFTISQKYLEIQRKEIIDNELFNKMQNILNELKTMIETPQHL